MIWLYRLLFAPVFLALLPHYALRMLRRGGYGRDFAQRFGAFPKLPPKRAGVRRLWIQAVSVGEVCALEPLLKRLAATGGAEVVLTTTTSTARKIIRERIEPLVLAAGYFPFDFWLFSRRAWARIQPDALVLMEGELWPENLHQAAARAVPVTLVNARLSDRSFRRYSRFKTVARALFGGVGKIGAATAGDAARFAGLGVPPEKITVTGNLKFDAAADNDCNAAAGTGTAAGADAGVISAPPRAAGAPLVLLGSSTWPGEEALLLETLAEARRRGIAARLLIVPRHAERRREIAALLEATSWRWFLRSQRRDIPPDFTGAGGEFDVCVADTTGELRQLTAPAALAFVGKSIPPNDGGQTPIECAALGVPVVYGPRMSNFRDACRGLEEAGAAKRVADAAGARDALLALLGAPEELARAGAAARRWFASNLGATTATLALLGVAERAPAVPSTPSPAAAATSSPAAA
ncbi:MAG: hypothetical protein LBR07_03910 [Puniceicoccales bacterium]|jgi:3-deoxy-D-manno-octulosonic-acid transferase|nr:hypothetical protein [Puniceicoccales bacterium]